MDVNPDRERPFEDPAAFDAWLAENHATADELWLRIYKKASGVPTIVIEEAIEVALIWGWIDGIKKGATEAYYHQRFTPRRKRSKWSERNRGIAERLIAEGRMQPSGLREVTAAKADGRWDAA